MSIPPIEDQLRNEHERVHQMRKALLTHRDHYLVANDERTWRAFCGQLRAFADHIDQHFSFEEQDGFLVAIVTHRPRFANRVDILREEHERIRTASGRILAVADSSKDAVERHRYATNVLNDLLTQLDQHERRESELVQEAWIDETGRST